MQRRLCDQKDTESDTYINWLFSFDRVLLSKEHLRICACTGKGKDSPMTFSQEEPHEAPETSIPTPAHLSRIHWTAVVSFVFGLFFVVCAVAAVFFAETPVGRSIWDDVIATTNTLWEFAPVLYTVSLVGVLYALAGWIFGLVACYIAQRPAWRKGFRLAHVGLGFAVLLFAALVVLIISYLSIPCMSADACHIYNQSHP